MMAMTASSPLYHNVLVSPRLGGGEKVAIAIHRYAAAQRLGSSELLVPAGGESERAVAQESLQHRSYAFEKLMSPSRFASLLANADLSFKLRAATQGVLHVHSPFVYGALRPLRSVSKLRTILHLHLDYTVDQLRWALARAPDVVVVCARFMEPIVAEALAERGNGKRAGTRIAVAVNAVDIRRFTPGDRAQAKQSKGVAPHRQVYLMAANLAPHKGQETALQAVALLKARGHSPLLWLVGEEREGNTFTERLQRLVVELGIADCVEFLGFRGDVPELMHAADCLLLPSTSEGLPLSILEAQASKVTVVAAPTAGIPEVVRHGETGYLVPAHDAQGYAAVLESLLREPEASRKIAEAAYRKTISEYTLDRYCARILSEYDELLGSHVVEPAA